MRYLLIFLCFLIFVPVSQAQTESIAVVVNEDVISVSDLNDRLQLIMVSSGFPDTEEVRTRLAPQIIGSLIEEQLKLQEAVRLEIQISPDDVDEGFTVIAAQNNVSLEKFKEMLVQGGINVATLERQVRSQISWSKVIQKKFRPRVIVSDSDVDAFIERIESDKGKKEFFASEIFLPVDESSHEADIKKLANRLLSQARQKKGSFFKLAQQFSKAPGAPQGGSLGWVRQGQLAEALDVVLIGMEKGAVSTPIRSKAGYHILLLQDVRMIGDESIPSRDQVERMLGIQRLERMQARHLLNLKSEAFIESRV